MGAAEFDYLVMVSWFFMGMLTNALMRMFDLWVFLLVFPFWWLFGKLLYDLRFKRGGAT